MHLRLNNNFDISQKNIENLVQVFFSEKRLSVESRKVYGTTLRRFVAAMPLKMQDLRLENIESYLLKLEKTLDPTSVNSHIRIIKSFFSFISEYGFPNIGRRIMRVDEIEKDQRCITQEEYDKVIATPMEAHLKDSFILLCHSGLRVSGYCKLKPCNIAEQFIRICEKGSKPRSIPINKTLREMLDRNPNLEFIHSRSRKGVWKLCQKIAKMAQIPTFHPHSARHFFANSLFKKGVPIYTISKILGHASIRTTELYLHSKEDYLRGATDVLDG